MNNKFLLEHLRSIPDFPTKGINFRDVTTLFKNAECLRIMEEELYQIYKDKGITKIVGIESRGHWQYASTQESSCAENRGNFLPKPFRKATPKNMARTPLKSTRMRLTKMMSFYSTTICLQREEP